MNMNVFSVSDGISVYLVLAPFARGDQSHCVICQSGDLPSHSDKPVLRLMVKAKDSEEEGLICLSCAHQHAPLLAGLVNDLNSERGQRLITGLYIVMRSHGHDIWVIESNEDISYLVRSLSELLTYIDDTDLVDLAMLAMVVNKRCADIVRTN